MYNLKSYGPQISSQIAGGWRHTVALDEDGQMYGWGWNKFGQVGVSNTEDQNYPQIVKGLADQRVTQVSCGWRHTVALTDRGNIYSWGRGTSGQLGHGDAVDRNEPKRIELLSVDGLASWQIECSQPDNATGKPFNCLMTGNIWHCNNTFTDFSFIWGPKFCFKTI
jgi:alpha-tubulin suppressor-like RCC1 family protein